MEADTEFTLEEGDYMAFPPLGAGEARNDSEEEVSVVVASILPGEGMATPVAYRVTGGAYAPKGSLMMLEKVIAPEDIGPDCVSGWCHWVRPLGTSRASDHGRKEHRQESTAGYTSPPCSRLAREAVRGAPLAWHRQWTSMLGNSTRRDYKNDRALDSTPRTGFDREAAGGCLLQPSTTASRGNAPS